MAYHAAEGVFTDGTEDQSEAVLQLRAEGFSGRQIAAQGMSRHSVGAVLEAADREGLGWDDVAGLDEAEVYARLFPGRGVHDSVHAQPDWADRIVHRTIWIETGSTNMREHDAANPVS